MFDLNSSTDSLLTCLDVITRIVTQVAKTERKTNVCVDQERKLRKAFKGHWCSHRSGEEYFFDDDEINYFWFSFSRFDSLDPWFCPLTCYSLNESDWEVIVSDTSFTSWGLQMTRWGRNKQIPLPTNGSRTDGKRQRKERHETQTNLHPSSCIVSLLFCLEFVFFLLLSVHSSCHWLLLYHPDVYFWTPSSCHFHLVHKTHTHRIISWTKRRGEERRGRQEPSFFFSIVIFHPPSLSFHLFLITSLFLFLFYSVFVVNWQGSCEKMNQFKNEGEK